MLDTILVRVTFGLVLGLGVWLAVTWRRLHAEVVRRRGQVENLQRIGTELTRALDNFRRNNATRPPDTDEDRQMEVSLPDVPEQAGADDMLAALFEPESHAQDREEEALERLFETEAQQYDVNAFEQEQKVAAVEKPGPPPRTSFERVLNDDED